MERAKLKSDFSVEGSIIYPNGGFLHGEEANYLFRRFKKEGDYVCPDCGVSLKCINKAVNHYRKVKFKKKPHFRARPAHLSNCPYFYVSSLNRKERGREVLPSKEYFSKLIEPRELKLASKLDKKSMDELLEYDSSETIREQYTTSFIGQICENYEKILRKAHYKYEVANKILSKRDLYLPGSSYNFTYKNAFYSVNSKKPPQGNRIFYGILKKQYTCKDGYILVFNTPKYDKGLEWKPILIIILNEDYQEYELKEASVFFNPSYLEKYNKVFTFGKLEEHESNIYVLKPDYLRWIYFFHDDCYKGEVKCFTIKEKAVDECAQSLAKKIYIEYQENINKFKTKTSNIENRKISDTSIIPKINDREKIAQHVLKTEEIHTSYQENSEQKDPITQTTIQENLSYQEHTEIAKNNIQKNPISKVINLIKKLFIS